MASCLAQPAHLAAERDESGGLTGAATPLGHGV